MSGIELISAATMASATGSATAGAFTLGNLGTVASIIGTAFSAIGGIQQGKAASNAATYNAQIAERNAIIARQQAAADEQRQRRMGVLRLGAARAAYGEAGVELEGSPLDILEQSAAQEELDALTIRYKGELRGMGAESEAALNRAQAPSLLTQGYMKAGSAVLLGGAQALRYDTGRGGGTNGGDRIAGAYA